MATVLGFVGISLWYIFVFAQSTTNEIKFKEHAVIVGIKLCKPPLIYKYGLESGFDTCEPIIKDDLGQHFYNKTGKETELYFSDKVRVEGTLIEPDEKMLEKYDIDGILIN